MALILSTGAEGEDASSESGHSVDALPLVIAVDWRINIDGDLSEWGAAECVPMDPSGERIGVRGVFSGWPEHQSDVCTYWDAENLYIGVAVTDDSLDAKRIPPERRKFRGPKGEKNAMFYFDHLKIFVRGPNEDTGFNVWISPQPEDEGVFAWGGRQRLEPSAALPIRASTRVRYAPANGPTLGATIQSYELALPWTWLDVHPYPQMMLDAMFLLVDSDRPGESLSSKVARDASTSDASKWIWWRHQLVLEGEPPGLQPPPPAPPERPESPLDRPLKKPAAELVSTRVGGGISRLREREDSVAALAAAREKFRQTAGPKFEDNQARPPGTTEGDVRTLSTSSEVSTTRPSIASESTSRALSRISQRNRELFARSAPFSLPPWVHDVDRAPDMSGANVDTIVAVALRALSRQMRQGIGGRTDMFVIDPARAARVGRPKVKRFLHDLASRAKREIDSPAGKLRAVVETTATRASVDPTKACEFLSELLHASGKIYSSENKVTTTRELVKKARKKAGLNEEEARAYLKVLLTW